MGNIISFNKEDREDLVTSVLEQLLLAYGLDLKHNKIKIKEAFEDDFDDEKLKAFLNLLLEINSNKIMEGDFKIEKSDLISIYTLAFTKEYMAYVIDDFLAFLEDVFYEKDFSPEMNELLKPYIKNERSEDDLALFTTFKRIVKDELYKFGELNEK